MMLNANLKSTAVMLTTKNIITGPSTHSVGEGRLVTVAGVCRRLSLSYVVVVCNIPRRADRRLHTRTQGDDVMPHAV